MRSDERRAMNDEREAGLGGPCLGTRIIFKYLILLDNF